MVHSGTLPRGRTPRAAPDIVADLAKGGPTAVALSGGVDSAVVACLAYAALGPSAVAVTLAGPAVSTDEVRAASRVAETVGIVHHVLRSDPLSDERYAENPSNRCYFCRSHEGDLMQRWGRAHGIAVYLDGVHVDDLGDDRPGLQAMNERGFRHPLVEAGWTKADVRAYARTSGLPNWDRPSNACLASRIAHGQPITASGLAQVARAEDWLLARGYRRVRVRVSGTTARVEVGPEEVAQLQREEGVLADALQQLGFTAVEVAPDGYRSRSGA